MYLIITYALFVFKIKKKSLGNNTTSFYQFNSHMIPFPVYRSGDNYKGSSDELGMLKNKEADLPRC